MNDDKVIIAKSSIKNGEVKLTSCVQAITWNDW